MFRCPMFNLSESVELLFVILFFPSWIWVVVSVMLYDCSFCMDISIYLFVLCV